MPENQPRHRLRNTAIAIVGGSLLTIGVVAEKGYLDDVQDGAKKTWNVARDPKKAFKDGLDYAQDNFPKRNGLTQDSVAVRRSSHSNS